MTTPLRRAINNGLIAGAVLIFLILIGFPGGDTEEKSLPYWFIWGVFLAVVFGFGLLAARPRNVVEERRQKLSDTLRSGVVVGIVAAVLFVILAFVLNAFQLWEQAQPVGGVELETGIVNKVTRVQDVFFNVVPRTTAVMAALPTSALKPPDGVPRAEPGLRFILMSGLFAVAGLAGGAFSYYYRRARERRAEYAGKELEQAESASRRFRLWLPLVLPLIFFGFIVMNSTLASVSRDYQALIGGNAQLAGLIASFLLIASGLLAFRSVSNDQNMGTVTQRLLLTLPVTAVLFTFALAAPVRPQSDMMYSPAEPNPIQVTVDGQTKVVLAVPEPISDFTLYLYRTVTMAALGILFVIANADWNPRDDVAASAGRCQYSAGDVGGDATLSGHLPTKRAAPGGHQRVAWPGTQYRGWLRGAARPGICGLLCDWCIYLCVPI